MTTVNVTDNVTEVTVTETGVTITLSAGAPGVGVPPGGSQGQVLAKTSALDYATDWVTPQSGGNVLSVNTKTGTVTLGPEDLLGVNASRLIGRGGSAGNGPSQEISVGTGLKLSGTILSANFFEVAAATNAITVGTGLTGGGELKNEVVPIGVDFAASGTESTTKAVRADDQRITPWSNATPTVATNLPGIPAGTVIPAGETAIQVLNRLLYPYQSVAYSNFSVSGLASAYEIGQSFIASGLATWNSSGPTSNWVSNSGFITFTNPSGFTTTVASQFQPTANSVNIVEVPGFAAPTNPRVQNAVTFSLGGSQAQGSVSPANLSRSWFSRMYFGKSTNGNLLTPTFDVTGTGSGALLQTTAAQGPSNYSAVVGAGAGFFYLFIHDAYTLSTAEPFQGLRLGGFALALDPINPIITVQLTNGYGVTANYKRYKSLNSLNDAITVVVNPT